MKRTILALALVAGLSSFAGNARAVITRSTYGSGDGSVPGGPFNGNGNLLQSSLSSTMIIRIDGQDSFYRENSGYAVDLTRLYDGSLGTLGSSGLGGDGRYCVFPNKVTLQFNLNTTDTAQGFSLSEIKTYASWDSGRSGQAYTVNYSLVENPTQFSVLYAVAPWNNTNFPTQSRYDYFLDRLVTSQNEDTSSTKTLIADNGSVLVHNVAAVQFVFDGYQNGGTAYREFQINGTASVPEPSTYALLGIGAMGLLLVLRKKKTA